MTSPRHSQIELQFHGIPVPEAGYTIRVFLNQPGGADAHTPTEGNANFAGEIDIFGHGPCAGEPGHCDPPDAPRAAHDLRDKHHQAPFDYDMDVTEAFNQVATTADEVDVSLVFVDAKGNEVNESDLELGGVSLVVQN